MHDAQFPLLLRAIERIRRDERADAWMDVRRAIDAAPRAGIVRLLASRLLRLLGDYRGALDEARAAAALGVPWATMQRVQRAHEIGAHREVREVLESMLSAGASPAPTSRDARAGLDQALRQLVRLYADARYDAAAAATLERYLPGARPSVPLSMLAVRVYVRREDSEQALAVIRQLLATPLKASIKLEIAAYLFELGAFDAGRAVYESLVADPDAAPPALEALGRLCLWAGDLAGPLAYAERIRAADPAAPAARRIDAAVKVLQGRSADALPILDALLRDAPRDGEAYLWRAEAHLRLGHRAEAKADADRSMFHGYAFAAAAVHLLGELVPGPAPRAIWRDLLPELEQMRADARAVLADHACDDEGRRLARARSSAPRDQPEPEQIQAQGLIALLEQSLVAMRGNRTPLATWMRGDGALVRLRHPPPPRDASRDAMQLIRLASPEEALAALDAVAARFPDSSMPWVYRGELELWLGRYAEARADLDRAIAIHRQTRWAWYGLACLDLLAGEPERALATCAAGIEVMDHTEGPVAYLVRGEAYRLLDRLDDARAQLTRSCEVNPTRLSAWINLALVHGLAGDRAAQRDVFRRLAEVAPAFVSEAALEVGDDAFGALVLAHASGSGAAEPVDDMTDRVLHQMLAMMRGNRSSSCITYFTADGQMRHVPHAAGRGDAESERRTLSEVETELRRAAASR